MVSTELREALVHNGDDSGSLEDRPPSRAATCRRAGWKWAAGASGLVACGLLVAVVIVANNQDSPSPSPSSGHFSGQMLMPEPGVVDAVVPPPAGRASGSEAKTGYTQAPQVDPKTKGWAGTDLTKSAVIRAMIFPPGFDTERMEKIFDDITDPTSSKWLQFLSKKQIQDQLPETGRCLDDLWAWLESNFADIDIDKKKHTLHIEVTAATEAIGKVFGINFQNFSHPQHPDSIVRTTDTIRLPPEIESCVDHILGLQELPQISHSTSGGSQAPPPASQSTEKRRSPPSRGTRRVSSASNLAPRMCYDIHGHHTHNCTMSQTCGSTLQGEDACCPVGLTLIGGTCMNSADDVDRTSILNGDFIRSYYNLASGARVPAENNYGLGQGTLENSNDYTPEALRAYLDVVGLPDADVKLQGSWNHKVNSEANLDIQCLLSTGAGAKTYFMNPFVFSPDVPSLHNAIIGAYDWLEDPLQLQVIATSYTVHENIAHPSATGYAVNTAHPKHEEFANRALLLMALRGVGFFSASGDSGASSGAGNNPIDLARTAECGGGKNCAISTKFLQNNQCVSFTFSIRNTSNLQSSAACSYPQLLDRLNDCLDNMLLPFNASYKRSQEVSSLVNDYLKFNNGCTVEAINNGDQQYMGSNCSCGALYDVKIPNKYEMHGHTYDMYITPGYQQTQFKNWFGQSSAATSFDPFFPSTSPYVTAVGGTQLTSARDNGCRFGAWDNFPTRCTSGERAVSYNSQGGVTSGGGFSTMFRRPRYQETAVKGYLDGKSLGFLPPPELFNHSNRGFPDVSLFGGGALFNVDSSIQPALGSGTSYASPWFAGLMTQLNFELSLRFNRTVHLGALNPLLYHFGRNSPQVYNDVVLGDNACTESYCSTFGYRATSGWDPVTGFGSIDFPKFRDQVINLLEWHQSQGSSIFNSEYSSI